jgi:hypothetical protein
VLSSRFSTCPLTLATSKECHIRSL